MDAPARPVADTTASDVQHRNILDRCNCDARRDESDRSRRRGAKIEDRQRVCLAHGVGDEACVQLFDVGPVDEILTVDREDLRAATDAGSAGGRVWLGERDDELARPR